VPGGVVSLRYCGFSSRMAATVVSARPAMTSSPVMSGTTMESYAAGSARPGLNPYRRGCFAIIAAAISLGT
jgi:hypothetical protein